MDTEQVSWKLVIYAPFFCALLWLVVAWAPQNILGLYTPRSQAAPVLTPVPTAAQAYADADALVTPVTTQTQATVTSEAPQGTSTVTILVTASSTPPKGQSPYLAVTEGCGHAYSGDCVHMRSAPDTNASIVANLRKGVVLKIAEVVVANGRTWYKIAIDSALHHPERVTSDWYVAADVVSSFYDQGETYRTPDPAPIKTIVVDRSEQMLYAYDEDVLFMSEHVSTGLELTPTPAGEFTIYKKTPSRYMQGPLPGISDQEYDLPGVPWNLYFTQDGAVIHGAYWHNKCGQPWSHGCVNLPLDSAKKLYEWATVDTKVIVQD